MNSNKKWIGYNSITINKNKNNIQTKNTKICRFIIKLTYFLIMIGSILLTDVHHHRHHGAGMKIIGQVHGLIVSRNNHHNRNYNVGSIDNKRFISSSINNFSSLSAQQRQQKRRNDYHHLYYNQGSTMLFHHRQNRHHGVSSLSSSLFQSTTRPTTTNKMSQLYLAKKSSSSSSSSGTDSNNNNRKGDDTLQELKRQYQDAVGLYETNMKSIDDRSKLQLILSDLERESSQASFWDAENKARNEYVTSQISKYSQLLSRIDTWKSLIDDCDVAFEMILQSNTGTNGEGGGDGDDDDDGSLFTEDEYQSLIDELVSSLEQLQADNEKYQLELLLSDAYDDQACRIVITAGAGGTEANDWVADLKRMYIRHGEKMNYHVQIEDEQPGDVVGYKSVELIISTSNAVGGGSSSSTSSSSSSGQHPYGWFKNEKGTHRLVRLSPFNANNKRQTTFAGVDVAPILNDNNMDLQDIVIPDKDLEITTMRSGGAGGQNVNKVNSAVRIKHLPSGLNVKCTQERSQALNREIAMKRLKGQLLAIVEEQKLQQIQQIRGDQVEASWGTQIRNYVLHPYKLIKDQRTGWETSNVQNFLDGNLLEDCIGELLRYRAKEQQQQQQQQQEEKEKEETKK